MAVLKDHSIPFHLEHALASDRIEASDCFVLDVGHDENGEVVASLAQVIQDVDDYLLNVYDRLAPVTKLYVIGEWNLARRNEDYLETDQLKEVSRYAKEPHNHTKPEQEWHNAGEEVVKLIKQMPGLKELTWISGLPFMASACEKLPKSLTKLVLDLGQPVRLQQDAHHEYKSYITAAEMKPLQQQTKLEELRLFHMHDSLQLVVWETVYRNTASGGMRVLDLEMAAKPLVRLEHWHKANDVFDLTVTNQGSPTKEYKGVNNKGVLHHSFGTGEYLDVFCMRKARIASGLEQAEPLSLTCLRLDGFVLDHIPFQHELSKIQLLVCGENCVDSGLRAPLKRMFPIGRLGIYESKSYLEIQWPNWTGVFNDLGEQCERPSSPSVPLTKEALNMKDLVSSLDGGSDKKSSANSNTSLRGSEVPTPTISSTTCGSPTIPGNDDGTTPSRPISHVDATLVPLPGNSPISTDGSFEKISPVTLSPDISDFPSDWSTDSSMMASQGRTTPRPKSLTQKVRQSWAQLFGSAAASLSSS